MSPETTTSRTLAMSKLLDPEAIARSYVGTPFVHQGRTPGVALDCAGVVICIARQRGHVAADFDVSNYAQQPDKWSIIEACDEHLMRIRVDEARPGDVLVMAWDSYPQHLGIMGRYSPAPNRRFTCIHAFMRPGEKNAKVTEHPIDNAWLARCIRRAYRFPEVT